MWGVSRKLGIILPVVAALIIAGVYYLYDLSPPEHKAQSTAARPQKKAAKPRPVHVTTVQRGTISHTITATGDILANAKVAVFSKVEGRLEVLQVEQGDRVRRGQIIARIAHAELQARVERATAELDVRRAQWAQMQAGERPEDIAQSLDRVQHTKAEVTNAKRALERAQALYRRGLYATRELDDANMKATQAQIAHATAEKQLSILRTGARIEDRQALQAQLRAAQAALRLVKTELQNAVITAPITGLVSHRHVDPGAYITDRTALVTIVDMDAVKIRVPISERDIGGIQSGLQAQIRVDAYVQEVFAGTVQRISPTIDPSSRSGEVEILVDNADHRLKPGMFAKVTLVLRQRHQVLLVPRQAVRRQGDQTSVFVVQDGKAHRRQVTIGWQNETQVEILDNLTPGTTIVSAGHHKLKDKAPIKIVQPQEGL